MLTFLHFHPCNSSLLNSPLPFHNSITAINSLHKSTPSETTNINSAPVTKPSKTLIFSRNSFQRSTQIQFCIRNGIFSEISNTQLSEKPQSDKIKEIEELELRGKPSPLPTNNGSSTELLDIESKKPDEDEVLAPFLKFFKPRDSSLEEKVEDEVETKVTEDHSDRIVEHKRVLVEYYEPKPGDFVVGVVVSGNENKLDVNVGADLLGTMLTKEVLPLYDKEMENLLYDGERDAEDFLKKGKLGIVRNDDAINGGSVPGRPVVETGTVLFAEVLGRTLSGRPLLSTRRFFRRIAWHRVRQIHQLNEPIEVTITEWNTGGLLTRIEGLRAFIPKGELMNKVDNISELKENVGRRLYVQISRMDEASNNLILSEREAWEMLYLQEGTLLEGTVRKIFPYGAQIRIGDSNRSGLLHISKITCSRIMSVNDLLAVDEKVKVLVISSMFPGKISLSIADLESEPGLFVSNKEKVFMEAEEMAKKYRRRKLPAVLSTQKLEPLPETISFDNEEELYANWKWFKFENDRE